MLKILLFLLQIKYIVHYVLYDSTFEYLHRLLNLDKWYIGLNQKFRDFLWQSMVFVLHTVFAYISWSYNLIDILIKLSKIDPFNWSNYKYLIKKMFLLKKINFYISNIIASIIATFVTYCDIRQVAAITCRNIKIIASWQNYCGNHPWLAQNNLNELRQHGSCWHW